MNILVVEDDPLLQRVIPKCLPGNDFTIVSTAELAISHLMNDSFTPDRILCDYELKGVMTGLHVHQWLQEFRPQLLLGFIFCTSHTELAQYHSRLIAKPFSPTQLQKIVAGIQDS
jgi:CheY-like chemotaxis protein